MHKNSLQAGLSRIALAMAIVATIFVAMAPTASAAGNVLTVEVPAGATVQVYNAPSGDPIFNDKLSGGPVNVDMYTVAKDGGIWLRLGDGTQSYHPAIGETERWIPYRGKDMAKLSDIYTLPKVYWTKDAIKGRDGQVFPTLLRVVEEPVSYTFPNGSDQYVSMTGDLGAKPEYLLDLHFPVTRTADLRLYADWANETCTARLNGSEQVITNTTDSKIYNGVFRVVSGTCALFSTTDQGVVVTGVKRSFSSVYVQSGFGGYAVALAGLMAIALATIFVWRRRKLAKAVASIAITLILATMLVSPALAGPGGPTATPSPTGTETATPVPESTEVPTTEASPEAKTEPIQFNCTLVGHNDQGELWLTMDCPGMTAEEQGVLFNGLTGPAGQKGPAGVGIADVQSDGQNIAIILTDGQQKLFALPKGADGAPGLQGPEGQVGPQGPQGPAGKNVDPLILLGSFAFNVLFFIALVILLVYVWRHKHEDSPAFKTEE